MGSTLVPQWNSMLRNRKRFGQLIDTSDAVRFAREKTEAAVSKVLVANSNMVLKKLGESGPTKNKEGSQININSWNCCLS